MAESAILEAVHEAKKMLRMEGEGSALARGFGPGVWRDFLSPLLRAAYDMLEDAAGEEEPQEVWGHD